MPKREASVLQALRERFQLSAFDGEAAPPLLQKPPVLLSNTWANPNLAPHAGHLRGGAAASPPPPSGRPRLRRVPPSSCCSAGGHLRRSDRNESSTAGSASIRSPSSMSKDSGSIRSCSSRENGSISKPGTWDRALAISLDRPVGESPVRMMLGTLCRPSPPLML